MSDSRANSQTSAPALNRRALCLLSLLFLLSGCAALVYEVVWFQMLSLVIGSSAISLGLLLGIFMGGMCAGSLLAPRVLSLPALARLHPLRVYAGIELGIGALGLLLLGAIPLAGNIYIAWSGTGEGAAGSAGIILRGLVAAACLLPPAMLMGATLPAIARWVPRDAESTPSGARWLGLFYGGNIFGAVAGCLLAAFYLLRFFDITIATLVAVALNFIVALASWLLARGFIHAEPHARANAPENSTNDAAAFAAREPTQISPAIPQATPSAALPDLHRGSAWPVYAAIAISGMTALACEVLWTRQLAVFSGATVFAFALILAVFLFGLGLGASAGAALAARIQNPRMALGVCQLLLCAAIFWAAWQLAASLPYWPVDLARMTDAKTGPWYKLRFDLLRCAWAMLPATLLWGMSFPLALAAITAHGTFDGTSDGTCAGTSVEVAHGTRPPPDASRFVGRVYGANTLGAIAGAVLAALWLLPALGSHHTQQLLIGASGVSGILSLGAMRRGAPLPAPWLATLLACVAGAALIFYVPPMSPDVLAYGRLVIQPGRAEVLYAQEGISSTVAVSRTAEGELNYHGAGKVQASTEYQDMRLQRILGHLTTLLPANPKNFLVIGFGAGITGGAVSIEPGMERATIVEIEPLVPLKIAPYFKEANFDLINNPRARVVIDDGRHFLLTTRETFDGITSDPLDPWVRGTAALYTREFFALARQRLNPGGVMTQFVQLYESNEEAVKSEIATFFEVFPEGLVFANNVMGQGYDLVLLGQASPAPINLDELEERLDRPEYARVAKSLEELGFYSPTDLLGTYVARAADLRQWLAGAAINRDRNLRLQYLAGLGLNEKSEAPIYNRMTAAGPRFSREVFTGSAALMEYLQRAIESGSSR